MNPQSQLEADIQTVEISIDHAKEAVELGEAIERLKANRDFERVIGTVYMRDEASRLTLLLGDQALDDKQRNNVQMSLRAIGEFFGFLRARSAYAEQMRKELSDYQEQLDTLRHIEANGEDEEVTE